MKSIQSYLLSLGWLCSGAAQNYYSTQTTTVCSGTALTVTALETTCDSPGTFYYGSGGYRNSDTCKGGDKAKVLVYFDINWGYNLEEVAVTMTCSAGNGGETVSLFNGDSLCDLDALSSINGTDCPAAGSFKIETSFYFSSNDDDYGDDDGSSSFTPLLMVGFASADADNGEFDLGGANTNNCAEVTTFDTTVVSEKTSTPLDNFLLTFGILFATLSMIFIFAFYMYRQRVAADLLDERNALVEEDANANSKEELLGTSHGRVVF